MIILRERLVERDRKKMILYPTLTDLESSSIFKILECVIRDTKLFGRRVSEKWRVSKEVVRNIEAIVVGEEDKSYADLLKVTREKIPPYSIAARNIRTQHIGAPGINSRGKIRQ